MTGRVLIIGGMHRSGTSLTAHWLETCGLEIGDQLLEGDYSNPKGHFEDLEISIFQQEVLASNDLTHVVRGRKRIEISPIYYERARGLVRDRWQWVQWGWKDPRTCLLLDFWKSVIPDAKFLFLFRHYAEVVESLLRRERVTWWDLRRIYVYTRVWKRYNDDIVDFAQRYPDDCLLVDITDLLPRSAQLIEFVNRAWSFALEPKNMKAVFDADLLHRTYSPLYALMCAATCPTVLRSYAKLQEFGARSLQRIEANSRYGG